MRLFHRKWCGVPLFDRRPIIEFNTSEIEMRAREYVRRLNKKPHLKFPLKEDKYIEAMLVVHLPYRLACTGRYQVVFYSDSNDRKISRSKREVQQAIRKHFEFAFQYGRERRCCEVVRAVRFPSTASEWFMKQVGFRSRPVRNSTIDIRDPLRFYSDNSPSVKMVIDYLNEGYM